MPKEQIKGQNTIKAVQYNGAKGKKNPHEVVKIEYLAGQFLQTVHITRNTNI